jgi:lipopolysaccharide/colanic/teichoic acid biosynthesis glycosyltransferase
MPAAPRIELTAAVPYDNSSPTLPLRIAVGTARGVLLPRQAASAGVLDPERLRRALNLSVALVALALVAPLLLLIALLVRLTSPGPVFYLQTRVGMDRRRRRLDADEGRRRTDYGGKPFTIYKFRTMRVDQGGTGEVWASPTDPRVTPVGRVLRKYRLDELPQLINVIKGDMNIVGPRPEQPKIFADLRTVIDRYPRRQRVLPGITGWAQINQSYDQTYDDVRNKVRLDLEYIENCSPASDLKIMLRTVPVIVFQRGAW